MLLLEDDDLFLVYFHKPSKRIIGLTSTIDGEFLKVQLNSLSQEWGNISLWTKKEIDIFQTQWINGEIEMLKVPLIDFDFTNFNCQGPLLG